MEIYTTGFSGWIANVFFSQLKDNSVGLLIDIRRHPNSELAGFTRAAHFEYFLKELSNCDYKHMEELAPNPDTLKQYRNKDIEWDEFSKTYIENLDINDLKELAVLAKKQKVILLCSETSHEKCHRSLIIQELLKLDTFKSGSVINLTPLE